MKSDGSISYVFVQHNHGDGDGWTESALEHLLFADLTFDERRGETGAQYRALLRRQSDLWQNYGIEGFVNEDDAKAVLHVLRERHSDMRFRLVRRVVTQVTEPIAG